MKARLTGADCFVAMRREPAGECGLEERIFAVVVVVVVAFVVVADVVGRRDQNHDVEAQNCFENHPGIPAYFADSQRAVAAAVATVADSAAAEIALEAEMIVAVVAVEAVIVDR